MFLACGGEKSIIGAGFNCSGTYSADLYEVFLSSDSCILFALVDS